MDVSVVIVNYNTKDIIKNSINSIIEYTSGVQYEIIVVDNHSEDGSQTMIRENFPNIILVENKENFGFGKANNLGAKKAKGKYLLFLNPDCLIIENTIKSFHEYFETYNTDGLIGAVGALLYDKDMKLNSSYQKFPTVINEFKWHLIPIFNNLFSCSIPMPKTVNYSQPGYSNEVDFIVGADIFVRKNIFDELHGFDEKFFMYFEEADLQKRMARNGLKRIILKNQKIMHLEGYLSKTKPASLKPAILFIDSMYKYFRKFFSYAAYIFFYLIITPTLFSPLFSKRHSLEEKKEYVKILLRYPLKEVRNNS